MHLTYIVKDNKYENLKQVLKQEFDISDRLLLKLKQNQKIYLNGQIVYIHHKLALGDVIDVYIDFEENNSNIVSTKMDLDILYEDECMLILNKPAGVAIHPSCKHFETSISNGVRYYFDSINLKKKIRPVNRLDKDTSGIVIFAKNEYIQECLVKQMKTNTFKKYYITFVDGILENKNETLSMPIARKEGSIIERCISEDGDIAITDYFVITELTNMSMLYIYLQTGRTHQIRVHMSCIGHPIIGDSLYGESSDLINRQALHACKVSFVHPITKENLNIEADLPKDMQKLMQNR